MCFSKGFSGQVLDPVTELVMTLRYNASPLTIEGAANRKVCVAAVTLMVEVWGIWAILQEEGILSFLRTQFYPLYPGRLYNSMTNMSVKVNRK